MLKTDQRATTTGRRVLSSFPAALLLVICVASSGAMAQAPVAGTSMGEVPDLIVTKDGKSLSDEILSMGDGKISYRGASGLDSVSLEEVKSFQIRQGPQEAVDPGAIQTLMTNQARIMDQLAVVSQALANLERRLMNVQTTQDVTQRQLIDRTVETDPLSRVTVVDYKINRRAGNTTVSGRIINQSEAVS